MAFRVQEITGATRPIVIPFAGQELHLEYCPYKNTPACRAELAAQRRKLLYDLQAAQEAFEIAELRRRAAVRVEDDPESTAHTTELVQDALAEFERLQKAVGLLDAEEVARLVDKWDAEDEKGHIPPSDLERVATLPDALLEAILKAIDEADKVNPPSAPAS